MARAKIAITLDEDSLAELDRLVQQGRYANRSKAIETAVRERIDRERRSRLARECANLNPEDEQALAEEGMTGEREWPEY